MEIKEIKETRVLVINYHYESEYWYATLIK